MLCGTRKRPWVYSSLLLVGCTSVAALTGASGEGGKSSASGGDAKNPFLSAPATEPEAEGRESCLVGTLALGEGGGKIRSGASIELTNSCASDFAVLVSPVEVRTLIGPDDAFHWEGTRSPFAVLYIYRRDLGHPKLYGDWGKTVRGEPGYAVVPSSGKLLVPIDGFESLNLPPGAYVGFLRTWVVPTILRSGTAAVMDLRNSIAEHNKRNEGKAEVEKALSFIEIETSPSEFSVR